MQRTFLLSPANASGKRAGYLLRRGAAFQLAQRLKRGEATIGECYAFMSGLYFRGKLAYATAFGAAHVIVPGLGLVPPETVIDGAALRRIRRIPVDPGRPSYARPLALAAASLGGDGDIVLLGSIATAKYLAPLAVLGARLHVPRAFIGRGDMERGAMMLRAARSGIELEYVPATFVA